VQFIVKSVQYAPGAGFAIRFSAISHILTGSVI